MKRQIRLGVFESNSSSSHTICLTNKDAAAHRSLERQYYEDSDEYINPSFDGYLYLRFGDFGWEIAIYMDEITKLQYCLTMVAMLEKFDNEEEFYKTDGFKLLDEFIRKNTSYDGLKVPSGQFTNDWDKVKGSIDHQSSTDDYISLKDWLNKNRISLEKFILDPEVLLVTDNDNH